MGGKATAEIPKWVDKDNPDEVQAFVAGMKAGRAGKPQPERGKFYVVAYAGWVAGNEARAKKGKKT